MALACPRWLLLLCACCSVRAGTLGLQVGGHERGEGGAVAHSLVVVGHLGGGVSSTHPGGGAFWGGGAVAHTLVAMCGGWWVTWLSLIHSSYHLPQPTMLPPPMTPPVQEGQWRH